MHEDAIHRLASCPRTTDRREDRLFDQFKDSIDRTRTDLTEAALLREHAARLELELKHVHAVVRPQ